MTDEGSSHKLEYKYTGLQLKWSQFHYQSSGVGGIRYHGEVEVDQKEKVLTEAPGKEQLTPQVPYYPHVKKKSSLLKKWSKLSKK